MTPNPSIRLTSVMQTLEQVVFPAVEPSNSLAVEQCGVITAQLKMLLQHLPVIDTYHRLCLAELERSIANLPPVNGGSLTTEAASSLNQCLEEAESDNRPAESFHKLGFALEDLIRAAAIDGEPAYKKMVNAEVLEFAKGQSLRERVWFKDSGFDPRPEELPSLNTLLGIDEAECRI